MNVTDHTTALLDEADATAEQLTRLASRVDSQDAALLEKDEIIGLLTDRLEQAAEQLDRVKRTGADRGPRGLPSEFSAEQQQIKATLDGVADVLDGVDFGHSFHRVELLLEEVRDAVVRQTAQPAVPAIQPVQRTEVFPAEPDAPADDVDAAADSGGVSASSWEEMKSALLGDDPSDAKVEARDDASDSANTFESDDDSVASVGEPSPSSDTNAPPAAMGGLLGAEVVPAEPLPDGLPEAVDFETADRDTLIEAIERRDKYIAALSRRVADRLTRYSMPTDWEALAAAPDQLVNAVQHLNEQWHDAVRVAEVDLCLERAKLSRERTRLEQLQASVDAQQSSTGDQAAEQPKAAKQKWRNVLGLGDDAS